MPYPEGRRNDGRVGDVVRKSRDRGLRGLQTCLSRCKATWKREFKLSWHEADSHNHHDDVVDSDQSVVNPELFLSRPAGVRCNIHLVNDTPRTHFCNRTVPEGEGGLPSESMVLTVVRIERRRVPSCSSSPTRRISMMRCPSVQVSAGLIQGERLRVQCVGFGVMGLCRVYGAECRMWNV